MPVTKLWHAVAMEDDIAIHSAFAADPKQRAQDTETIRRAEQESWDRTYAATEKAVHGLYYISQDGMAAVPDVLERVGREAIAAGIANEVASELANDDPIAGEQGRMQFEIDRAVHGVLSYKDAIEGEHFTGEFEAGCSIVSQTCGLKIQGKF